MSQTVWPNTQIDMRGIDTIFAMPLYYINFNLDKLMQFGTTPGGAAIGTIDVAFNTTDTLKAKVKAFTMQSVTGSSQRVRLTVLLESGTLTYVGPAPSAPQTADVKGLSFSFFSDVNVNDVTKDPTLDKGVAAQVAARMKNVGPGAYSIMQMFAVFDQAAIATPDMAGSHFPSGFPAAATKAFQSGLNDYMKMVHEAGGGILGYAVTVPTPAGSAGPVATFPPTDVAWTIVPYQPATGQAANPALDCLTYIMMTGGQPLPKPLPNLSGSFVGPNDANAGIYGWMGIRFELFRDYILSQLGPFTCSYLDLADRTDDIAYKATVTTGALTPTATGGVFVSPPSTGTCLIDCGFLQGCNDAIYTCNVAVDLEIVPGTNTIVINRSTSFKCDFTHWYGYRNHAVTSVFSITYSIPVRYTVTLVAVANGAIQVSVDQWTCDQPSGRVYDMPYGWLTNNANGSLPGWFGTTGTFDAAINDLVNMAQAAMPASAVQNIQNSLNIAPFILPGGADLFQKNPVFSANGDLVVSLTLS